MEFSIPNSPSAWSGIGISLGSVLGPAYQFSSSFVLTVFSTRSDVRHEMSGRVPYPNTPACVVGSNMLLLLFFHSFASLSLIF